MSTSGRKGPEKSSFKKSPPIVEIQNALNKWYDLRFNQITNLVEGRKRNHINFITLNENNLYIELLSSGYRVTMGNLCALLNSDFVPAYNPFTSYFESLPRWNGQQDHIENLANHIKARNQRQFNHHFKKMLVRVIACALDDRYFNKHAFILVGGEQNTGKSTFCRWLCPDELLNYLTETIPNDKDGLISLCENILINLDELSTMSKFELNHLKSP